MNIKGLSWAKSYGIDYSENEIEEIIDNEIQEVPAPAVQELRHFAHMGYCHNILLLANIFTNGSIGDLIVPYKIFINTFFRITKSAVSPPQIISNFASRIKSP